MNNNVLLWNGLSSGTNQKKKKWLHFWGNAEGMMLFAFKNRRGFSLGNPPIYKGFCVGKEWFVTYVEAIQYRLKCTVRFDTKKYFNGTIIMFFIYLSELNFTRYIGKFIVLGLTFIPPIYGVEEKPCAKAHGVVIVRRVTMYRLVQKERMNFKLL